MAETSPRQAGDRVRSVDLARLRAHAPTTCTATAPGQNNKGLEPPVGRILIRRDDIGGSKRALQGYRPISWRARRRAAVISRGCRMSAQDRNVTRRAK